VDYFIKYNYYYSYLLSSLVSIYSTMLFNEIYPESSAAAINILLSEFTLISKSLISSSLVIYANIVSLTIILGFLTSNNPI
jgi:hypothetical protein